MPLMEQAKSERMLDGKLARFQAFTDEQIISALRNPLLMGIGIESQSHILAEALARLLERIK